MIRFPQQTVRQIIYSTVDIDRIGGAAVFKPAPTIAHRTFNERLSEERQALPRKYIPFDRNVNGRLERDEMANLTLPPEILRRDRNSDGHLTPAELWSGAPPAARIFANREVLNLGDRQVELVYPGPGRGSGDTLIFFPAERILFAASYPMLAAPFQDRSMRVPDLVRWSNTVAALDFDTLLTAEGEALARSQLIALNDYVNAVMGNVASARKRGLSLEQTLRNTPNFSNTPFAVTRDGDITFAYDQAEPVIIEAYAATLIDSLSFDQGCTSGYTCHVTSPTGAAKSVGVGLMWRNLQATAELSPGHQVESALSVPGLPSRYASRDTHVTVLAGWRSPPTNRLSVAALLGPTFIRTNVVAVSATRSVRYEIQSVSWTLGGELRVAITSRLHVMFPVRVTNQTATLRPGRGSATRAGVGLNLTVFRWVP